MNGEIGQDGARRALVIGTSNAIVRGGWFDGFANNYPGTVTRHAFGGAPFVQFMGSAKPLTEQPYDDIILETSPNDESYSGQVGSGWFFGRLYDDLIRFLVTRGRVLVLRVPPQPNIGKDVPISSLQRAICERNGACYFDLSPVLQSYGAVSDLYRDRYHPNTPFMHEAGAAVAEAVLQGADRPVREGPVLYDYKDEEGVRRGLDEIDVNTSLWSGKLTVVPEGKAIHLPRHTLCFGFYFDKRNCNGVVRLHGIGAERDIQCFFEPAPRSEIAFVPIRNGFVLNAISVQKPFQRLEYALHSKIEAGPYKAAIGTFVCHPGI